MAYAMAARIARWFTVAFAGFAVSCFSYCQAPKTQNVFHTSWSSENGLSAVFEVQQDLDGYLWLTTANGISRFDGASFQSVDAATDNAVHNRDVLSVYVAPSGRIWFTTRTAGLILLENGHAQFYPFDRRCISVALTRGMTEDADGSLWVRALSGLFRLKGPIANGLEATKVIPAEHPLRF